MLYKVRKKKVITESIICQKGPSKNLSPGVGERPEWEQNNSQSALQPKASQEATGPLSSRTHAWRLAWVTGAGVGTRHPSYLSICFMSPRIIKHTLSWLSPVCTLSPSLVFFTHYLVLSSSITFFMPWLPSFFFFFFFASLLYEGQHRECVGHSSVTVDARAVETCWLNRLPAFQLTGRYATLNYSKSALFGIGPLAKHYPTIAELSIA